MNLTTTHRCWLIAGLVALTAPLQAQEADRAASLRNSRGDSRDAEQASAGEETSKAKRERWRNLPAKERKELQRLHSLLRRLPEEQRRELRERLRGWNAEERRQALRQARQRLNRQDVRSKEAPQEPHHPRGPHPLRGIRREVREGLSTEEGTRLRALPEAERRKEIQRLVRKHLAALPAEERQPIVAALRQRALSRLPPAERQRLEALPPEERRRALHDIGTRKLFRRTFRRKETRAQLRKLSPRELRRSLGENASSPEFLPEDTWKRWQALESKERNRVLRLLTQRLHQTTHPRDRTEAPKRARREASRSRDGE